MDPAMPGAGGAGGAPLVPWNAASVKRFCPYCTPANETALWRRGRIVSRWLLWWLAVD